MKIMENCKLEELDKVSQVSIDGGVMGPRDLGRLAGVLVDFEIGVATAGWRNIKTWWDSL